jgi:hypothetical protein
MWQPIKVLGMKETNKGTILQVATDASKEEILKYSTNGRLQGELRLEDGRMITAEQRKKVFATIKDFSLYTGYDPEYARQLFTLAFCYENGIEPFSLSDCSLETAREFINYLIDFCIDNDIPLSENAIERTDDINKYLYLCIKKSICSVCGKQGVVYSLSNGNKIFLCNLHYDEAKIKGLQEFERLYKVYPIRIKGE